MEDWEKRCRDKTAEPYTPLHIEQRWPHSQWHKDREWWLVHYRAYSNRSYVIVQAQDELEAYMLALNRIKANKRKADRLHEKNQEGAN